MYSQLVSSENLEKLEKLNEADLQFQKRIDKGESIENTDSMPEGYRKTLIRQISQHAHSEIIGMQPEANWITRAPSLYRKTILLAKVQDECGHGLYLYSSAETLGGNREELTEDLLAGKAKFSSIFSYPTLSWADIGVIGWLVDGAAIINQVSLCKTSYAPYAKAMYRICKEESFHQRQGFQIMYSLCRGSEDQKQMAQDSLDRWWWATLMMFGPHDKESPHSEQSMKWRIKVESNDELRKKFINQVVPQAEFLGLRIPDEKLRFNEAKGEYETGEIDWDEFYKVITGYGIQSRERLEVRQKAHAKAAWLDEAVRAYTLKTLKNREKKSETMPKHPA